MFLLKTQEDINQLSYKALSKKREKKKIILLKSQQNQKKKKKLRNKHTHTCTHKGVRKGF